MKPDKAIEILENERKEHHSFSTDIVGKAEALGIEALKFWKGYKIRTKAPPKCLLPGETEE